MKSYDDLVTAATSCKEDIEKAENGNKAAATRARKSMQDVKNLAQQVRKDCLGDEKK